MENKPTASRNNSTDYATASRREDNDDRSNLSNLYPEPKSYIEKVNDADVRQKYYRRRWPKYPELNIAVYGTALSVAILWFMKNIYSWWFDGNVISSVSLSFGIGIILTGLLIAWINYVNTILSYFGRTTYVFWLVCTILAGVISTLWQVEWVREANSIVSIAMFIALNFLVIFFSARVLIRGTTPSR